MILKITEADRLKSKTAEAGWYTATITELKGEASKSGKSINFWTTFTLEAPLQGKEVSLAFNTEMDNASILGSLQLKPYSELIKLIAMVEKVPVDQVADNYDTDSLLQRKVDIQVGVHIAEGSPINIINSFLPEGEGKNQKAVF